MPNNRAVRELKLQFEKGELRDETLLGRDYLVAPVVAMVEGVRFGANQESAELGLASEFGDTPIVWANRPLVLNHPKAGGSFVSANTPDIMEQYQFGVTMNPTLEGKKLKMEAWIDLERVSELGDEFEDTVQRIRDQADVEVSVGFFSDVKAQKGVFKGQKYSGVWTNIKPDHLAILSDGVLGACSVEDGCGVPRLNQSGDDNMAKDLKTTGAGCSCGGNHTQEDHSDTDGEPVTQGGLKKMLADLLKPFTMSAQEKAEEAHLPIRAFNETYVKALEAQAINPKLMDTDNRKMISQALRETYQSSYPYLLGFTQDLAVFEMYSDKGGYCTYSIGVNVGDKSVEFVGEPIPVLLQTKIVTPSAPTAQEVAESTAATTTTQEEKDMSKETVVQTEEKKVETPKVLTAQEYIDSAPPEVKEILTHAIRAQEVRKTTAIKALTDAKAKFTEDFLKAQTVDTLEAMVGLLPPVYTGVNGQRQAPVIQSDNEDNSNVPAPSVFAKKAVA